MKIKNLKSLDKIMYVLMLILATITIFYISFFIVWNTMELMNTQEYSKILINANLYREFYNILTAITPLIIPMIIIAFFGIIPYLIILAVIFIFFTVRYIEIKEKKISKIITVIILIGLTIFLILKGVSIYPLTGKYEIQVDKKVSEVSNTDVRELLQRELKEDYYVYKIEIYNGFPDDYTGYIKYKDIFNEKQRFFMGDAQRNFVEKNAINKTNEYSIKATLFLLAGDITYIAFILVIQKEFVRIAKKKENDAIEQENFNKSKIKKIIIYTIISLLVITILFFIIVMLAKTNKTTDTNNSYSKEMNENYNEDGNSSIKSSDILYQKRINQDTIVRVVNLGTIIAQRSVVGIEKSTNGGKTFIRMSNSGVTIHNGAEFCFINENVGFINDFGLAGTGGDNKFFKVTTDGGKTFVDSNIVHPDSIEEKNLLVKGVPYIEDGKLKLEIYTLNHAKQPERTYYIFYSNDNGLNWTLEKKKD